MKKKYVRNSIAFCFVIGIFYVAAISCKLSGSQVVSKRPVDYVNPLIGTAPMEDVEHLGNNPVPDEELYYGCVNPGAMVPNPNGKVCAGPVSGFDGLRYHVRGSGYRFTDETIMGFTNMNGEYHDDNKLLFMPTVGAIKTIPGSRENPFIGYRSAKDVEKEKASPGYYTVVLTTYNVKVELTATKSCGFQKYTFPKSEQANVLIDLANSQPYAKHASVSIVNSHTIQGVQEYSKDTVFNIPGGERMFFYAVFSKVFKEFGTWENRVVSPGSKSAEGLPLGAYVTFNTKAGEEILVKVGTSTESVEDAANKLSEEIPDMDFDAIRQQADDEWSEILNKVVVEGGSEAERINFYTAVYRKNGYGRGGILPQFESTEYSRNRIIRGSWGGGYWGPGAVGRVVGACKNGTGNYDIKAAYEKFKNDAINGEQADAIAYRKYGYIPSNSGVHDYVNRSLGLAYEDYAMAELAKIMGNKEDYLFFLKRSKGYKKMFNSSTGFFTPQNPGGSWILPLNPFDFHAEDIYREGNAWNYLWFNIGDIPGLIELLGGKEVCITKLDTFFSKSLPTDAIPLRDCTGLIGLYCHGNEQYRHIPYLYNYLGEPWKTQEIVRLIQTELYRPIPAGMCGMDDYGNLEGWYATSVLGFNVADRASGYYEIGSPVFPKATIALNDGIFTIEAHNVSNTNKYIQSATLNGKPLNVSRFKQSEIISGGSLIFEMEATPNKEWGIVMNASAPMI
ncbi:GH92 family glycosyl hydrolase [Sunxiuqinia sp. A32]|uniref:GH92 family glycosyl hydrolase n=1 Tax=Sunxiuqinia sp. A32 TaxID=3461496 RepID=UPI00404639BC